MSQYFQNRHVSDDKYKDGTINFDTTSDLFDHTVSHVLHVYKRFQACPHLSLYLREIDKMFPVGVGVGGGGRYALADCLMKVCVS